MSLMPTATVARIITFAVVGTAIVILSTKTPAYGPWRRASGRSFNRHRPPQPRV